jgi:hypothetical protein
VPTCSPGGASLCELEAGQLAGWTPFPVFLGFLGGRGWVLEASTNQDTWVTNDRNLTQTGVDKVVFLGSFRRLVIWEAPGRNLRDGNSEISTPGLPHAGHLISLVSAGFTCWPHSL